MDNLVELRWYLPLFGVVALLFVVYKNMWVSKQDPGNDKMQFIAGNIAKGAMAFLKAEYKILSIFVVAVGVLLYIKGGYEFTPIPGVSMRFIPSGNLGHEAKASYLNFPSPTKTLIVTPGYGYKNFGSNGSERI